jgi:AcrR family transcriptional regulator
MQRRMQAERRTETRARLLASARWTFARYGYHATSLDRVSENAGYTKGAVYDHFGSKEGLFLALLDQQFATRIEQAQASDSQPPSKAMPFDREFALLSSSSSAPPRATPSFAGASRYDCTNSGHTQPRGSATHNSRQRSEPPPTARASKRSSSANQKVRRPST